MIEVPEGEDTVSYVASTGAVRELVEGKMQAKIMKVYFLLLFFLYF